MIARAIRTGGKPVMATTGFVQQSHNISAKIVQYTYPRPRRVIGQSAAVIRPRIWVWQRLRRASQRVCRLGGTTRLVLSLGVA